MNIEHRTSNIECLMGKDKEIVIQDLTSEVRKQMKLNCGAKRHHYSMFNVDIAAKRRKKHKNKISGLVISMGYETEIREF